MQNVSAIGEIRTNAFKPSMAQRLKAALEERLVLIRGAKT
jgi:hypothetical protein